MTDVDVQPSATASGRMFSPDAVGIATFIGWPIAGGVLLALNYRSLRRTRAAWTALAATFAATALFFVAAGQIRIGVFAGAAVAIALAFGMVAVAKGLQGKAFEAHLAAGGQQGSSWLAAGIALPFVLVTLLFAATFVLPDIGERYDFGGDQAVYYDDGVTRKQAGQVGKVLAEVGYFDDSGPKDVLTRRDGDTYVVSFVLRDDMQITPQLRDAFRDVGDVIAERAFDGAAVDVQLVDSDLDELP